MNDIMLDLETMGNGPDAAIIAIGAVEFDIKQRTIGNTFYVAVDLQSSVDCGGVITPSTVIWWMQQSEQAIRGFIDQETQPIEEALSLFSMWMECGTGKQSDKRVWGCGSDFDNVILASAYRRMGKELPWHFWNNRCYRTLKAMHPHIKMQRTGTHHNAVDDAVSQARHLIEILNSTI